MRVLNSIDHVSMTIAYRRINCNISFRFKVSPSVISFISIAPRQEALRKRDEDKFAVTLDARHYSSEEITLKLEEGKLIVKGKHHRESEHGFESSEFSRSYTLPPDVDPKSLTSNITKEGTLHIEANKVQPGAIVSIGDGEAQEGDGKFRLNLNVSGYKPDELTVKVQGRDLIIRGEQKSEEKGEESSHYHHKKFIRQFSVPEDVNLDALTSKLSKDGKLCVEAPRDPALLPKERVLAIEEEKEKPMEQ